MTATRWLDAIGTSPNRAPVRTMYAQDLLDRPDLDALYVKLGGGIVGKYRRSTFPTGPLVFPFPNVQRNSGKGETLLQPDAMFNVDTTPGWSRGNADAFGQNILNGFDVDAEGNVLVAATVFGWGLLDTLMRPLFHRATESPSKIIALKGTDGKPYAVINGARGGVVFDYTDKRAPVLVTRAIGIPNILQFATAQSFSRVAIIDDRMSALRIWTADALASGAKPLFNEGGYSNVTSDGTNFFALKGNSIDVLVPSGDTYRSASVFFNGGLSQVSRIHYGGGDLVQSGVDASNVWAWRVFAVSPDFDFTPVTINVSQTLAAEAVNANDGVVIERGGIRLLVLSGGLVGDVYQLGAVTPPPVVLHPPTIASISPNSGPAAGGQTVTITGTNLIDATVTFSDILKATVTLSSDSFLFVVTPIGVAGGSNVRVNTPGGTAVVWNGYTYTAVTSPVVTAGRIVEMQAREFDKAEDALAWADSIKSTATTLPPFRTSKGSYVVAWF